MIEAKSAKKLLFKSGRIIDPFTKKTFNGDILVENGKISKISDSISSRGKDYQVVDCNCLLYTSPSPRDATLSRMPSSA